MASVVADLIVNLIGNDAALLAATKRSAAAMEDLATTSVATTSTMAKGAAGAGAATASMGSTAEAAMKQVGAAGKYAGLALLAIGGYSVEAAAKFQAAMELIHTQAGASQQEVENLSKAVLALAPTVGIGPDKLAEGLYHVESAGFRGQQALDILTMAAKNAATGMSNMEDAAQAMVGTMAVGFKDVTDAADAAAYLNRIVGIGDMRMQQLSSAIATGVLPTFKDAGLGMTDFGAALATLTDNVTPANQAATRLRMTIALLAAPSKNAFAALTAVGLGADEANKALANRAYLEKYGISISKLSDDLSKPDGLLVAVQDLKSHLAGLSTPEQAAVIEKAFGGGRTSAAIQTLLSQSDRLKSKYDALGTAAQRAKDQQEAWAQTQATFKQQANQLGAGLQVMAIQLGTKLLPPLTKFVEYLNSHRAAMIAFFTVLLIFLGLMTTAFIAMAAAALANPVVWIVIAIIAAIALLAIGIYELIKHWSTVWGFIKRIAMDVWGWLVKAWNATWRVISGVVGWIKNNIIDPIVDFFLYLVHGIEKDWHLLLATVDWVKNNIFKPIADFAWNWLLLPVRIIMDLLIFAFKFAWGFISTIVMDFWKGVIKPFVDSVVGDFKWLMLGIEAQWNVFVGLLKWVWGILKLAYDGFKKDFIDPVFSAFHWLASQASNIWHGFVADLDVLLAGFSRVWNGIKDVISAVWNFIKPILEKIQNAFHDIQKGLGDLNPSKLGSGLANFFHFADGGVVPGPVGAPMLAVVHGGEVVLPNTVTSTVRSGSSVSVANSSAGAVVANFAATGAMDGGVTQVNVHIDGKKLLDVLVTRAQRNKGRNSSTFLQ